MLLTLLNSPVSLRAVVTLLPPNRTAFEAAADETGGARFDAIDPDVIKSIIDPYKIPLPLLPWLAWQLRVEIWNDGWSEDRKRWVVATSVARHRLKGTLGGIKAYLNLVDTTVVNAIVPPAKTYLSPSYTESDQAAYLGLFAQLRFYPFFARAQKKYATFAGSAYGLPKAFLGAGDGTGPVKPTMFPMVVGAQERYTVHVTLWDKGVEQDLTSTRVPATESLTGTPVDYYEVLIKQPASAKLFPGDKPKAKQYLSLPDAVDRIFRVSSNTIWNPTASAILPTTVPSGTGLIDSRPQVAYQAHQRQKGSFFLGECLNNQTPPPSIAWRNIYQYWYVFDQNRVPQARKRFTHLGWTRLGMPPYTAELQVSIKGKADPRETWGFVGGHLRAPSETQQQIYDARFATRVAMSVRDQVLLKTKTRRPIRPTDLIKVGSSKIGDWIRAEP